MDDTSRAFFLYNYAMFYAYILECADGTFYSGCTNDLKKRLHAHNNTKAGAHYTKIRRPVTLKWSQAFRSHAKARAKEAELKRMTREGKMGMITVTGQRQ
jgi:putative endonuclease